MVGWLCFTSHRQRGHLETASSFTHCGKADVRTIGCLQLNMTGRSNDQIL